MVVLLLGVGWWCFVASVGAVLHRVGEVGAADDDEDGCGGEGAAAREVRRGRAHGSLCIAARICWTAKGTLTLCGP